MFFAQGRASSELPNVAPQGEATAEAPKTTLIKTLNVKARKQSASSVIFVSQN
ncbi:hypothetical protein SGRA_0664 [Saprospira grandis str. Lewin]|uniref:Uncharacterized protein n=1 Tax=Saprospira grandis (strain Lewin) TaxID=984262 RepID=H6L0H3_SAPGL|nr:hypothetical protein SGRA_0664 [Saprospira grandis str. Lewin]